MKTQIIAISLFTMAATACKGKLDEEPAPAEKTETKEKSNVIKVTTAVPYGKHVACADMLPDTAPFTEAIGDEIGEIRDRGKSNSEATAVCSLIRAGQPPDKVKELKTLEDKYSKLGVLPGDEYCLITAYCSLSSDEESFKKSCEGGANQSLVALEGQTACLRATEKGAEYSYTYKFIEPDTQCIVETLAGPSVEDQEIIKNCALATRTAMTKESVAKFN